MMGTKKKIEVMQAAVEGEQIQCKPVVSNSGWMNTHSPGWSWTEYEYRVKREPRVFYLNFYENGAMLCHAHDDREVALHSRVSGGKTIKVIEVLDEGCDCE